MHTPRLGLCAILTFSLLSAISYADPIVGQAAHNVTAREMLSWFLALLFVLCLFFLCVWTLKRSGHINPLGNNAKLRVLSVVPLGMREKVVLMGVGNKQLVLAVTPGRIETLAVLEGEACVSEHDSTAFTEQNFAQKLMQVLQGKGNV